MKRKRNVELMSAYDEEIDVGAVVLTGEQARALVVAVADAIRHGGHDPIVARRMVLAVEALNDVFGLEIEKQT